MPVFYDISRYSTDKYFDIVWGCHPPGDPPNGPPKMNCLKSSTWVPVCYDISRYSTDKYFDIVWGCHPPPRDPQMDPQNSGVRWAFFQGVRWHFSLSKPVIFPITIAKKVLFCSTNFRYKIWQYRSVAQKWHPPAKLKCKRNSKISPSLPLKI